MNGQSFMIALCLSFFFFTLLCISHLFEVVVCTFADGVKRSADVVEDGQHSRRSTAFDQLADDLVVEVVDGRPFNTFLHIFFLLCYTEEE